MTESTEPSRPRIDLGMVLIVLGILGILWGVFHVLGRAYGPRARTFAERPSYNQVKVRVHESFPGGFAIAMAGLTVALVGGRIRNRGREGERVDGGGP